MYMYMHIDKIGKREGGRETETERNKEKGLWGMDYSPWSSKNSVDRNRLKKFMQVVVDVMCMHTNFGGRDLSGFGVIATFKNSQIIKKFN